MGIPFSQKLKTLREGKGLSQSQLADALFVTRQAVSKWERGAGMPDLPSLQKIADYFGVTIDQLANDEKTVDIPSWPEPLSNSKKSALFVLWDILIALGMNLMVFLIYFCLWGIAFESRLLALFYILIVIFSIAFLFGPIGLLIALKKRQAKGYWILAREINVNALALGAGFLLWSFLGALGSLQSYLVILGFFFLTIYGVSLGISIRLYQNAPQEAKA